jgi:hypothetical protein
MNILFRRMWILKNIIYIYIIIIFNIFNIIFIFIVLLIYL